MPIVTAVRARGARVEVELDGASWRVLPVAAIFDAGLAPGVELDRPRARLLAQALRRDRAETVALRTLARRDHSRVTLGARLERAGIAAEDRTAVIERAERLGLVDDERFASSRAQALAARGRGDRWIVDDLRRQGIAPDAVREAVSRLEPERDRAARLATARGVSVRTARWLAARGFSDETVEELFANFET